MPRLPIRFRPPGVKPWTRIGPLGPFRGRLGLAWVVAPLVLGGVLVVSAWLLLRPSPPPESFRPVGPLRSIPESSAREAGIPGVYVGRIGGVVYAVREEQGCPLQVRQGGYADCRGVLYRPDGEALDPGRGRLDLLPVAVFREVVYVDALPALSPEGGSRGTSAGGRG